MPAFGYTSKYSPVGWKGTVPVSDGNVDLIGIAGDLIYEFEYNEAERAYVVSKGSVKKITDPSVVIPGGGTFNTFIATWRQQLVANLKYTVNTVVYYNNIFSLPTSRRYNFFQSTTPPTVLISGTPTNLLHTSGASVATYVSFEGNSIAVHTVNKETGVFTCDHYSTSTETGEYTPNDYITMNDVYALGSGKQIYFEDTSRTYSINLSGSDFGGRFRCSPDHVIVSLDSSSHMRKIVRPIVLPLTVGTTGWKPSFCLEVGETLHTLKTIPATWLDLNTSESFYGAGQSLVMSPSQYIGPYSLWTIRLGKYTNLTSYNTQNYYQSETAYALVNANDESIKVYDSESYFDCSTEAYANRPLLTWNFYIPGYGPGQVTATNVTCHKDGIESNGSDVISGAVTSSIATPIKKFANVATYYDPASSLKTRISLIMPDGIIYADGSNLYSGTATVSKIPFKLQYPDGSYVPLSVVFTEVIDVSSYGLFDYSLIAAGATIATDANGLPMLL